MPLPKGGHIAGCPSTRAVDELLDERLAHRSRAGEEDIDAHLWPPYDAAAMMQGPSRWHWPPTPRDARRVRDVHVASDVHRHTCRVFFGQPCGASEILLSGLPTVWQ